MPKPNNINFQKIDFQKAASSAGTQLMQTAKQNPKIVATIVIVLIIAIFFNVIAGAGLQEYSKVSLSAQEKQMNESVQKHSEDLQRQQIAANTQRLADLKSQLNQFVSLIQYDSQKINETMNEYTGEKITEANLPRVLSVFQNFSVEVNEFFSHIDGFAQFIQDNNAEFKTLGGGLNQSQIASMNAGLNESKAQFQQMAEAGAKMLEDFAGSNADRQAAVADTVNLMRGIP